MPDKNRTMFERSAEVQWLVDRLRGNKPNEAVAYSELNEVCNRDVQGEGRGALASARRILIREDGIAFGTIRGEGLRRLDDEGVVKVLPSSLKQIRNKASRALRVSACVQDMANLDPPTRASLIAQQSYFGVIRAMTREKTVHQIEERCGELQRKLNPAEILQSLKDQGKNGR